MHISPSTTQKHKQSISKIIVSKHQKENDVKYSLIVNIFFFEGAQTNICTFREYELESRLNGEKIKSQLVDRCCVLKTSNSKKS